MGNVVAYNHRNYFINLSKKKAFKSFKYFKLMLMFFFFWKLVIFAHPMYCKRLKVKEKEIFFFFTKLKGIIQ